MFEKYYEATAKGYSKVEPLKPIDLNQLESGKCYVEMGDPSSGFAPCAVRFEKLIMTVTLLEDHEDYGDKGETHEWLIEFYDGLANIDMYGGVEEETLNLNREE